MLIRHLGRWLSIFCIAGCSAGAVVSCGSGAPNSDFQPGSQDASTEATSTTDGSLLNGDGNTNTCKPKTCAESGFTCGMNGDGCGGTIDCGSCPAPQFCGGGGYSKCGGQGIGPDGGIVSACVPFTCATAPHGPLDCGATGDGCGNILNCGSCPLSQFCGGGGFNQCGGNTGLSNDGGVPCTPQTTCPNGQNCGQAADGCGGLIGCGNCTNPQFCGGGGPSICGGNNGLGGDGGVICNPATTCPNGQNCGQAADGCGGLINCGSCVNPQYCGGGGPGICGGNNGQNPDGSVQCTPTTCQALGNPCGQQSDGCGGVLNCTQCVNPQTCGGGGVANQCGGNNGVGSDGGLLCTAKTCADFPAGTCGSQADGCGGATPNCGTCALPLTCGGGGVPSQCGNSNLTADGGNPCTPATSCPAGITCGQSADGCGGLLNCGSCSFPDVCGGGGIPGQCGNSGIGPDGGVLCTPTTCAQLGFNCGPAGDGCGGQLNCGSCTNPQYCGGGGPSVCGGNNGLNPDGSVPCNPTSCAKLGYNCGFTDDGCGNTLNCGTCTNPQYCGGGGYDVCGPPSLAVCPVGQTTYTGFVYDPGNHLPIYNALVYAPVGAVVTPPTGINPAAPSCSCSAPAAYASANTAIDGSFTLSNLPSGAAVTIVVQLGRWQRSFTQTITACVANTATNGAYGSHLTLPSTHLQGNIPRFAVDTGNVDSMECVLAKMGIATTEFNNPVIVGGVPTAPGRIHMYKGSIVSGGATVNNVPAGSTTPGEAALTETATVMDSYDVLLFPCQGGAGSYTGATWPNTRSNLITYANSGGRMFATHYHYDLLDGNGSFSTSANWAPGSGSWGNYYTDPTYNTDIAASTAPLAAWLHQPIVYGGTLGQIPVGVIRKDFNSVVAPAQLWITTHGATPPAGTPIHYTFDTPFVAGGAGGTCGRVVYSDFHVESQPNGGQYNGTTFPGECQGGVNAALTPQEKLLEYMIFDLTSCVAPPTCTPLTCANFPGKCGVQGDGCGGQTANCGICTAPATCGGGGVPDVCGYPDGGSCTPTTCAKLGYNCGPAGDGCGGTLNCGACVAPNTCGGGGTPGQCGFPDAGCTPIDCTAFPSTTCGEQNDGCGGHTAFCNPCTPPATCGGGGTPNQCGYPKTNCTPATCSSLGLQCGYAGDGCGGVTPDCGTCPMGSACANNMCVSIDAGSSCVPQTCAQLNIQCGLADDGCGNLLTCATCPSGQTCVYNQCILPDGGACTPLTCSNFPATTCGEQSDGCGGHTADCNPCTPPAVCGGGGTPNQCGYPDAGSCVPLTCAAFPSTTCGPQADGCGGVTAFCNPCTSPATCGGGGVAAQCGYPDSGACIPTTCAQQNIGCGPAGDGCGNIIMCGSCTPPATCGGAGVPSQCGVIDAGSCVPLTCASQHISCGPAGDGCGNLLQCGTCSGTQTCGGGGTPGQCGGGSQ